MFVKQIVFYLRMDLLQSIVWLNQCWSPQHAHSWRENIPEGLAENQPGED